MTELESLRAESERLTARCAFAVERWTVAVAEELQSNPHHYGRARSDAEAIVSAVLAAWDANCLAGGPR